jgi:chlorobactene glucosyltransferase
LLSPDPLEAGWYGKPFACSRLAAAATADWLLFVDADVRLQPGAADAMVDEAQRREASLLSCWPGLDMVGVAERVFLPMLNFVVFTLFPAFLSLRDTRPSLGLAHGACIMVRRDVYERLGGHAMVRSELFEDTALARAWRAAGEHGACLDGQEVVRVRMYRRFVEMWNGFTKNAYPAFRRSVSFWLFLALHAVVFTAPFGVAPVLFLAGGAWGPWACAAGCVLAMRLVLALRFGHPVWSAFLHPIASLALCAVALRSMGRCRSGVGVTWKGRSYRGGGGGHAV